jgi:hypothetical protein
MDMVSGDAVKLWVGLSPILAPEELTELHENHALGTLGLPVTIKGQTVTSMRVL